VRRFAAEGAKVAFIGRSKPDGAETERLVREAGGEALFIPCDIAIEQEIRDAVAAVGERYGPLDILINNAAGTELGVIDGHLGDIELDAWEQLIRVNLTGTFLVTKYALPEIERAGGGAIVNISSVAAMVGCPDMAAYSAAKGGMISLTRSIALDYAPAGIRCNCLILGLHPGDRFAFFLTDDAFREGMQAVHLTPRFGTPDDVALACVYLGSDESGFITGTEMVIDGGAHSATRFPMQLVTAAYSEYEEKAPAP
jgi:NAD(P)-dependent dehydrogenase (short-subunit alcohol dehydrogenase family)